MESVRKYISEIQALCKSHHVKSLYIFGSAVRNELKNDSDIDLIVDFNSDVKRYADNYFNLKFNLEDLFKRSVDLLEKSALKNPYLLKNINKTKVQIYG